MGSNVLQNKRIEARIGKVKEEIDGGTAGIGLLDPASVTRVFSYSEKPKARKRVG